MSKAEFITAAIWVGKRCSTSMLSLDAWHGAGSQLQPRSLPALGAVYLLELSSGVLSAGEPPSDVQEVHPIAQLCAHVERQLRPSDSLGKALGLQAAAPEVKAEGTVPLSRAGLSLVAVRGHGDPPILSGAPLHLPHTIRGETAQPTPQSPSLQANLPQIGPNKSSPLGCPPRAPRRKDNVPYLMPTTSTACSFAASSRRRQDLSVAPNIMLGWAEGLQSAAIPKSILHSKKNPPS